VVPKDHAKTGEGDVALDFNRYCSVSLEEMRALQRVVGAARELCGVSASDDADRAAARPGVRTGLLSRAEAELADSLSALDSVQTGQNGRNQHAATLAPWLHDYLRRLEGGSTVWRPVVFERAPSVTAVKERAKGLQ
jgi:hypothetical protein